MTDKDTRPVGRRSFLMTGATVAVTGLAGCQGNQQSGTESVKIGVLAPSPDNNSAGIGMANGTKLAQDAINANGGVLDSDLQVVVADTEGSAQAAREAYRELTLEENVDFTTGVFTAEALLGLMDEFANQETPHLTTGAIVPEAATMVHENYEKYKYHFRNSLNARLFGRAAIDFITQMFPKYGMTNIAGLGLDVADMAPLQNGVLNALREVEQFNVVMDETYASGTQNFNPLFDQVEQSGADVLVPFMPSPPDTAAVVQWARGERPFAFAGLHVPSQSADFYQETDGAAAYTVSLNAATPNSKLSDKTKPFFNDYRDQYSNTGVFSALNSYAATNLIAEAVEQTGNTNADELVSTLEAISYDSVQGKIEFFGPDSEFAHDLIYSLGETPPVVQQWQPDSENPNQGNREVIFPPEFRTAEYQSPSWIN